MTPRFPLFAIALIAASPSLPLPLALASRRASLSIRTGKAMASKRLEPDYPLQEIVSGYWFRTKETRAIQDDDLNNPGFFGVEEGERLWSKPDGTAAKSCASCHQDAAASMKGVGATMPKWSDKLDKPVNLEQQINICRTSAWAPRLGLRFGRTRPR